MGFFNREQKTEHKIFVCEEEIGKGGYDKIVGSVEKGVLCLISCNRKMTIMHEGQQIFQLFRITKIGRVNVPVTNKVSVPISIPPFDKTQLLYEGNFISVLTEINKMMSIAGINMVYVQCKHKAPDIDTLGCYFKNAK
jgi:hypothetical protein